MMWFFHIAVAVLGLLSTGHSAPVSSCDSLIQTIEIQGRDQLLGSWTYVAESSNIVGSKFLKTFVDSGWVKFTALNESNAMNVIQVQKMLGRCFSVTYKATVENNTISITNPSVSEVLLKTGCPDCLVVHSKYTVGGTQYSGLQLLSRRNRVSAAELKEYSMQVECLNLPQPSVLESETDFCPDESPSEESRTTDLTEQMKAVSSDLINLFSTIFKSEEKVEKLKETITSALAGQ